MVGGEKFSIQFQRILTVFCVDLKLNPWHTNLLPRIR
jgi:hypothetical protein